MAERRFTIQLDAQMNIAQVKNAVSTMQAELSKLNLPQDIGAKLSGTFTKLTGEIERFQAMSSKGIASAGDFNQLARSGDKILQIYEQLRNQVIDLGSLSQNQLEKMFPPSITANIKKANDAFSAYQSTIRKNEAELESYRKKWQQADAQVKKHTATLEAIKSKTVVSDETWKGYQQGVQQSTQAIERLQGEIDETKTKMSQFEDSHGGASGSRKSSTYRQWQQDLERLTQELNEAKGAQESFQAKIEGTTTFKKQQTDLQNYGQKLQEAKDRLNTLAAEMNSLSSTQPQAFQSLIAELNKINGINLDPAKTSLVEVQQAIQGLSAQGLAQLQQSLDQMPGIINNAGNAFGQFEASIEQTRQRVNQLDAKLREVEMLKSRITYFFGLTNSVQLLRRAMQQAFETVKELDTAMTQTAVVTDFSVGDMWEKLPEYTKNASKLGAATKELYEATTLYYQQGLKGNEVMQVGIETMKMARIAGMEAAEATEAMTAALRGFNMTVNETNAVHVNDVYSELAAITAADTEQIATAMTKTASIAHNANMEFETTAALLAQIIETTQEAPETAGTAMKTIIARFSEVKELQGKGLTTGEDEEGEVIDVNKIDKALRSVGISMEGFFSGARGLDEILLELAEKWDSLDFTTQRYIATMAAGSRQQSRFIAMMSDYKRTAELVGAANNSAGASQRQFEKTLDSLESKLNKLSNAWNEFTMGLTNNEYIKIAVDGLTALIQGINLAIDGLSKLFGWFDGESKVVDNLTKSLLTLGVTIAGLKLGGLALSKGLQLVINPLVGEKNQLDMAVKKYEMAQAQAAHKAEMAAIAKEHAARLRAIADEKNAAIAGKKTATEAEVLEAASAESAAAEAEIAAETAAAEAETAAGVAAKTREEGAALAGVGKVTAAGVAGEQAETQAALGREAAGGIGGKIGNFFKKNGSMMAWIGSAMLSITAISGIINNATQSIDLANYTAEEQIGALTDSLESIQEVKSEVSSVLNSFTDTRREIERSAVELGKLKKGSAEWASTIHNVQTQMNDILDAYPELIDKTEVVNGVITLTAEGWQIYENNLTNRLMQLQSLEYGLKIQMMDAQAISSAESLNTDTSSISYTEQKNIQTGQQVGGWVGGVGVGLTGAALGAKLGAFGGPIGLLIGAVLGGVIGTLVGGGIGGIGSTDGIAPETLNEVALAAANYTVDRDGEEVSFSAEAAMRQGNYDEIDNFLAGLDLSNTEINQLRDYITENAEEFDRHAQKMKQDEQAIENHIEALASSAAATKGEDDTITTTYANLYDALASDGKYQSIIEGIQGDLQREGLIPDASKNEYDQALDKFYREYAEIMKIDLKWNDTNNLFGDGVELPTYAEMFQVIATERTNDYFKRQADYYFENLSSGNGLTAAEKGKFIDPDSDVKDFTPEQIEALGQITQVTGDQLKKLVLHEAMESEGSLASLVKRTANSDFDPNHSQDAFLTYGQDKDGNVQAYYPETAQRGGFSAQLLLDQPTTELSEDQKVIHDAFSPYRKVMNEYLYDQVRDRYLKGENLLDDENFKGVGLSYAGNSMAVGISPDEQKAFESADSYEEFLQAMGAQAKDFYFNVSEGMFNEAFDYAAKELDKNIDFEALGENSSLFYKRQAEAFDGTTEDWGEILQNSQEKYGWSTDQFIGELAFLQGQSLGAIESYYEKIAAYDPDRLGSGAAITTEEFNNLKESFNALANNLSQAGETELLTSLMQVDWVDESQLELFRELAEDSNNIDVELLDNFIEGCYETGLAVRKIDITALTQQLETTASLIKKIGDIDVGETLALTGEELDGVLAAAKSLGKDLTDEFVRTDEGYVYIGNSMNDLRETLEQSNRILLSQNVDAAKTALNQSEFIATSQASSDNNINWSQAASWTNSDYQKILPLLYGDNNLLKDENGNYTSIISRGPNDPFSALTDSVLLELMNGEFNWDNQALASLVTQTFSTVASNYLAYESGELQSNYEKMTTEYAQLILSQSSGQEIIEMMGQKDKNGNLLYSKDVIDKVFAAQLSGEGADVQSYDYTQQINSQTQFKEVDKLQQIDTSNGIKGIFSSILTPFGAALKTEFENQATEKENEMMGKALALDASKNAKEYSKLITVFNEYGEALTATKRGSEEYRRAQSKIKTALEETYNIKVTEQFMLEHGQLLEKVIAGEEGAWEDFNKKLQENMVDSVNSIKGATQAALDLENVASSISPTIGVVTTFEGQALIDAGLGLKVLEGQVVATKEQLDGLTALYDLMGATVTFVTKDMYLGPDGTLSENKIPGWQQVKVVEKVATANTGDKVSDWEGYSNSKSSEWENPYDKLHNELEKINDTIRERERLERRYQSLLDRQLLTLKEARDLYKGQMEAYDTEAGYQRRVISGRYKQIEEEIKANPGMEKYVQVVDDGYGGKSIRIDWQAFEAKDGKEWEEGEKVEAFYDSIKEWLDSIYEAQEKLDEIADGMWELVNQGRDQYLDLEGQIIEALVNERQAEIDKLSEINSTITDTNSKLLDSMQEQLDEYRQNRDNQKTEEELSDKQRRLAYLQQDTSGANALEIMQLQKERDEGIEDYTDTLIDQKISALQEQNDKAAEQRQEQIDILQAQLDHDKEVGAFNEKAEALITEVMNNKGILSGTQLESLLKNDQNWEGMSKLGKMKWLEDLTTLIAEATGYRDKQTSIDDLIEAKRLNEGDKITFTTADGQPVNGTVQADGTVKGENGAVYSNVTRDWLGNYSTTEKFSNTPAPEPEPEPEKKEIRVGGRINAAGAKIYTWWGGEGKNQYFASDPIYDVLEEKNGYLKTRWYKSRSDSVTGWFKKTDVTAYKTGGLADFTGPAWLDGTKSKPEYILNADQTKAFFTLVDVLSGLQTSASKSSEKTGDNTYDIDINVESIGSDYDVEQLATTVKRLINEDARYRNNNTINLTR